ncbi:MAG TPA: MFS transporter [Gaiellaceae bacterium]|nr:MFS transporter [Gaiellaceae bacterium]
MDELVFGVREAAWPLIRHDLSLSYAQVGLALSLPALVSLIVEPAIGVLGDGARRRSVVVIGGIGFAVSLVAAAVAPGFLLLLGAFCLLYPSSGAFVGLSQATLVDLAPRVRERSLVRWTVAGAVGAAVGPLVLVATRSWRSTFCALAVVALVLVALTTRAQYVEAAGERGKWQDLVAALRRREVLRWLLLLELQDLGGDVLFGYLALYFVDVVGASPREAALAVAVWTVSDLVGTVVLLRALTRLTGATVVRTTAISVLVVVPALQLAGGLWLKLVLVGMLGALHSAWYPVTKARLYAELPGRGGLVLALATLAGPIGALMPVCVGLLASRFGLQAALWVVLVAPLSLIVGVPRRAETDR